LVLKINVFEFSYKLIVIEYQSLKIIGTNMNIFKYLTIIFIGGGIGAILRALLMTILINKTPFFPNTFIINIVGCIFLGFLFQMFLTNSNISPSYQIFLTTGILSAFTTFSTFSLELVTMLETGAQILAIFYAISSLIFGISGIFLGKFLGKILFS